MERALPSAAAPAAPEHQDTVLLADLPDDGGRDAMPTIGQIGRYALKYRIGAGGLGTVYAADDPLLSRRVAIKTLNLAPTSGHAPLETAARAPFDEMFLHEARAAAQLSHPHIVTVFDAGISPQGAYIAMELLKGKDLRELLAEGWRPTPGQAALIVRRVADALAYAHSKGVVHRDIKPANIFMVGRTQPKVLDFGIASIAHAAESGAAGGSPHYMAPEQVKSEPTDRRTDVFSLGVVLYELLCGRRAFDGESLEAITATVREHHPQAAYLVSNQVPMALSEIATRAMSKQPEDRYRSARVLSRELHQWLEAHPDALQSGEEDAGLSTLPTRAWTGWALVAGLGAVMLGVGFWLGMKPRAATAPAAPQAALVAAPVEAASVAIPETPASAAAVAPTEAAASAVAVAAPPATGLLQLAITPWANVEVDGRAAGVTPPLNRLELPAGEHRITLRNSGYPPHTTTITVTADEAVVLKHRFGR